MGSLNLVPLTPGVRSECMCPLTMIIADPLQSLDRSTTEQNQFEIQQGARELERSFSILSSWLIDCEYLVGNQYSIADIAVFVAVAARAIHCIDHVQFPALQRWFSQVSTRTAVQRSSAALFQNRTPTSYSRQPGQAAF